MISALEVMSDDCVLLQVWFWSERRRVSLWWSLSRFWLRLRPRHSRARQWPTSPRDPPHRRLQPPSGSAPPPRYVCYTAGLWFWSKLNRLSHHHWRSRGCRMLQRISAEVHGSLCSPHIIQAHQVHFPWCFVVTQRHLFSLPVCRLLRPSAWPPPLRPEWFSLPPLPLYRCVSCLFCFTHSQGAAAKTDSCQVKSVDRGPVRRCAGVSETEELTKASFLLFKNKITENCPESNVCWILKLNRKMIHIHLNYYLKYVLKGQFTTFCPCDDSSF